MTSILGQMEYTELIFLCQTKRVTTLQRQIVVNYYCTRDGLCSFCWILYVCFSLFYYKFMWMNSSLFVAARYRWLIPGNMVTEIELIYSSYNSIFKYTVILSTQKKHLLFLFLSVLTPSHRWHAIPLCSLVLICQKARRCSSSLCSSVSSSRLSTQVGFLNKFSSAQ